MKFILLRLLISSFRHLWSSNMIWSLFLSIKLLILVLLVSSSTLILVVFALKRKLSLMIRHRGIHRSFLDWLSSRKFLFLLILVILFICILPSLITRRVIILLLIIFVFIPVLRRINMVLLIILIGESSSW